MYASRISLSIGLVGVFLSFVIGCTMGGISGYYGGKTDMVIQRGIEILISLPTIPLWMALSAALPTHWGTLKTYFAITIILSMFGWAGLARVVRGKLLELREQDFVTAARVAGRGEGKIVALHLLPSFMSYLIVSLTLAVPYMILGETALSFLGLGTAPAGGELGHPAEGRPERARRSAAPVAADPRHIRGGRRARLQLSRRRPPRRRRPLQVSHSAGGTEQATGCR